MVMHAHPSTEEKYKVGWYRKLPSFLVWTFIQASTLLFWSSGWTPIPTSGFLKTCYNGRSTFGVWIHDKAVCLWLFSHQDRLELHMGFQPHLVRLSFLSPPKPLSLGFSCCSLSETVSSCHPNSRSTWAPNTTGLTCPTLAGSALGSRLSLFLYHR